MDDCEHALASCVKKVLWINTYHRKLRPSQSQDLVICEGLRGVCGTVSDRPRAQPAFSWQHSGVGGLSPK